MPLELKHGGNSINKMWLRRQSTKFNGVSYVVQRCTAAVFSQEGRNQVAENIDFSKENARLLSEVMREKEYTLPVTRIHYAFGCAARKV